MKEFRLRSDLDRAVVDGFALPLAFKPGGVTATPVQGYTLNYTTGEDDDPDTYTYQATISHEGIAELCQRCFDLLPDAVFPIVEIGSRDAYRSVDVFLAQEPVPIEHFRRIWQKYEQFLLEDGAIGAGANAETPFFEVFIDQRKCVNIHTPLDMQDDVEAVLRAMGLEQVPETWPDAEDEYATPPLRPVLDLSDAFCPDVDELLLYLRHEWGMQLNVDPEVNVDEGGRELGRTLWHVVVIVYNELDDDDGAYMSVWLTADSLGEAERLVHEELLNHPKWTMADFYTIDRVAYDERPEELGDLPPRPVESRIFQVTVEPWETPPPVERESAADGEEEE